MIKIELKDTQEQNKLQWSDIKIGDFFRENKQGSSLRVKVSDTKYLRYCRSYVDINNASDFDCLKEGYILDVTITEN